MSQQAQRAHSPPQCEEVSFVTHDGVRICGKAWGPKTGIPVLGMHGWLDNANTFDVMIPHLYARNPNIYFISIDFAGHGLSDHIHIQGDYLLYKHAEHVVSVIESLVGHSMGGAVATIVATVIPQKVISVVSIDVLGPVSRPPDTHIRYLAQYIPQKQKHVAQPNRKRVFSTIEEAVEARANADLVVTIEASRILCERGLEEIVVEDDDDESGGETNKLVSNEQMPVGVNEDNNAEAVETSESEWDLTDTTSSAPAAPEGEDEAFDDFDVPAADSPAAVPPPQPRKGYVWRTDARLLMAPPLGYTEEMTHAILSKVSCPSLYIFGKQSSIARALKQSKRWSALGKNAKVLWMEGRHHLHMEKPAEEVGKVVGEFVGRMWKRAGGEKAKL
ncbi:hypothetical protein HK102_011417 [Quaeritorhiza haematococci]|nr:hypothetical protein HK102_011417 [Quaeritorhiza haematococci]